MIILKQHKAFDGEVRFYQHDSDITKTAMNFSAFIPNGKIQGALIWLSGLTCNEENFISKAGALSYLSNLGLCLICPDTSPRGLNLPHEHDAWDFGSGASFYVNAITPEYSQHYKMQDYLMNELFELVNAQFALEDNISLFGHSMGGHGALYLGLTFPHRFKSISAFSPIVNPMACPWGQKAFLGFLGEDRKNWAQYDSCQLIENGCFHPKPILISQGTADPFLEQELLTENFEKSCAASLQALKLFYQPGFDHSYYFIASFIKEHINFHYQYLKD